MQRVKCALARKGGAKAQGAPALTCEGGAASVTRQRIQVCNPPKTIDAPTLYVVLGVIAQAMSVVALQGYGRHDAAERRCLVLSVKAQSKMQTELDLPAVEGGKLAMTAEEAA